MSMDISLDIFLEDIRVEPEKDYIYHERGFEGVNPSISDLYEKSWIYPKRQDASEDCLNIIFDHIVDCLSHVHKLYNRLFRKLLILHKTDVGEEIASLEKDINLIFEHMYDLTYYMNMVPTKKQACNMLDDALMDMSKELANMAELKCAHVDDFVMKTIKREQQFIKDEYRSSDSIADISYSFADIGDRYLFGNGDLDNAEKYYRIGIDAFNDLEGDDADDKFDEDLLNPCDAIRAFLRLINNVDISYNPDDDLSDLEYWYLGVSIFGLFKSFIEPYRELIKKDCCDEQLMHDVWEKATECFRVAKGLTDKFDADYEIYGIERTIVWITYIIIDHVLPFGLYLLSKMDASKVPAEIFKNAVTYYDKLPFFSTYIGTISRFKQDEEGFADYLRELLFTIGNVEMIKQILQVHKLTKRIAYYTTFDTLGYILPKSADLASKENEYAGKFSVMHIGHMNDPNEGKVLKQLIYDNNDSNDGLSYPYVFLKSFTTRVDDLSMWETYGNSAQGVCVELDTQRILSCGNYKLYNICYMKKDGIGGYAFNNISGNDPVSSGEKKEFIESIIKWLKEESKMVHSPERENKMTIPEIVYTNCFDYIVHGITYLFKDADYIHEDEKRIIYSFDGYDDKRIKHTNGATQRLLVYSEQDAVIHRIILGPKFQKVEDNLPYLQYRCEALKEKLGLDTIEIVKSHIAYI